MGRIYQIPVATITLDEDRDIIEILAATAKPVKVHGWHLFQTTDVGDAAEEVVQLEEVRGIGTVTSGSGGSSPTAAPLDDNDAALGATIEANNTTRLAVGTGTLETLGRFGWNIRIPWTHWYTPELRPRVNPGDRWTLGILAAALADAVTFGSHWWIEEL
jgi:hypothetical protein